MIHGACEEVYPQDMVKNQGGSHKRQQKSRKTLEKPKKTLDLWGGVWYIDYTSPRVFFLCVFSLPFRSNGNKIGHLRGNAIENQASGRGRILTAERFRRG
jgi:hypothetical protein